MFLPRSSQVTWVYIEQAVHNTFWSSAGDSFKSSGRRFSGGTPDSRAFNKSRAVVGSGVTLILIAPLSIINHMLDGFRFKQVPVMLSTLSGHVAGRLVQATGQASLVT